MQITQTDRLILRELQLADAEFMHAVLNDADFLANVGDRNVRTVDDAAAYIASGPRASYAQHGFGLWAVELRDGGATVGICGLLKRDGLDAPDVGFALLPSHRGRGYASEAASAALTHGREQLRLERVLAIVKPQNAASIRVLEKLGMVRERRIRLTDDGPELIVFAGRAAPPAPG
ncbi:MAG: GNAT family N-acetyltransferase [Gemmatimonadaceae bacterium]